MKKQTKIMIAIITLLIVILGIVLVTSPLESNNEGTVKMGTVMPLTGSISYLGQATNNGIQLAAKEIKEEYGEDSIEIIAEDSRAEPKTGVSAVNKLINVDNVDLVFTELTGVSLASSPVAKESNVPFTYSAFTYNVLDDNPNAVKFYLSFSSACEEYASYAKSKSYGKIGIIDETHTNGMDCVEGLKEGGYPEEEINLELVPKEGRDFKTMLAKMENSQVDSIVLLCYESTCLNIVKTMVEQGIEKPVFCNRDNCATKTIIEEVGMENMPETVYFLQDVNEKYLSKYKTEYGSESQEEDIAYSSISYDITYAVFEAARKCDEGDEKCIIESLSSREFIDKGNAMNGYILDGRAVVPKLDFYEIKNNEIKELNSNE